MMNLKKLKLKIIPVIISVTLLNLKILILIVFWQKKNHTKIFWLTTFYTKLWLVQKHCVLGVRFDKVDGFIRVYYLALKNMMSFTIGFDTLQARGVVFRMSFLIIIQESKLIHMILCL